MTRKQLKDLPSEDLADALEELSGSEQEALFSALDSEKAAETLIEAEPRAQRQLIANLRKERARQILAEMTIPQLANLFSVLPHDDTTEMMGLLPDGERSADQERSWRSARPRRATSSQAEFVTCSERGEGRRGAGADPPLRARAAPRLLRLRRGRRRAMLLIRVSWTCASCCWPGMIG